MGRAELGIGSSRVLSVRLDPLDEEALAATVMFMIVVILMSWMVLQGIAGDIPWR